MGQVLDWTAIVVALMSLLGCCAWFVEGRKHKPTAKGLVTDNRLKEMELGQLYVEQFEKNIADPLRQEVRELRDKVDKLTDELEMLKKCSCYRADCPHRLLSVLGKQERGFGQRGDEHDGAGEGQRECGTGDGGGA